MSLCRSANTDSRSENTARYGKKLLATGSLDFVTLSTVSINGYSSIVTYPESASDYPYT